nr:sel1 repeat family protein [Gammaproteobacteria bacterium]
MESTPSPSSPKSSILLTGLCVLLIGCSSSKQTARFCDTSGCSERPLTTASADYLRQLPASKSEQILQLEQAAASNPKAAYDLGLRYYRGDGVARNGYQALQWMRKAGDGGLLEAQKALGGFYLSGLEETGSDPQEAEKWLSLAAAQGDRESAELLEQAAEAKRTEVEDYRWRQHWRQYFRGYWYRGYPYLGHWAHGHWYYH